MAARPASAENAELLMGRRPFVAIGPFVSADAIFPGSFNPLHHGHRQIVEVAQSLLRRPVAFELSAVNVDKPPLDQEEIERRVAQFEKGDTVLLTCAPTFVAKAQLFPGATFIVGADTVLRIGALRYYNQDPQARDRAIASLTDAGCGFLVFGRKLGDEFLGADDLNLPPELRKLIRPVPEELFRCDVSSTELRRQRSNPP